MVKNLPANSGDVGSSWRCRLGRSPGGGNGNSLQYDAEKIPWTEEFGRLQSMGLHRVGQRATAHETHVLAPYLEVCNPWLIWSSQQSYGLSAVVNFILQTMKIPNPTHC